MEFLGHSLWYLLVASYSGLIMIAFLGCAYYVLHSRIPMLSKVIYTSCFVTAFSGLWSGINLLVMLYFLIYETAIPQDLLDTGFAEHITLYIILLTTCMCVISISNGSKAKKAPEAVTK